MAWRLAPLLQEHPTVLIAWGLLAALSALLGTLCMSAQADVKKKLVYSTVGQMGFMALQCASGAIGAALFHLLAHGLFKCYMFLQSGSAVAEGLDKRKFSYVQVDAVHSASSLWSKIFVVALGAAASIGLYVLCVNNGFTGISAAITACALFCGMPALERIDFKSLSLFWIAVMGIVLGGGLLSSTFEHLVQVGASANQWLLPLVLALFALISIALQIGRNSSLAKALYVHSLSGFYVDEISSGHSIAIATRQ
jgi:NADH:ubiquinone oxidoreductase subunit 5 (subunit L)/multisubunit Na+/H+ antiporter MnhA subunit